MARRASIGAAVAAVSLLTLATVSPTLAAAPGSLSEWRASPGPINAAFVAGTSRAVVGLVSFDQASGKPRGRVALVDARSARELWATEYRNSQCCLTPAVGVLAAAERIFASGDELLLVSLRGSPTSRVDLDGSTVDVAAAGGRLLVGTIRGEVAAFHANRLLWRAGHRDVMAVALSADGLAAAGSRQAVAIFDASNGRPLHQLPLTDARTIDLAFAPGAQLVLAQKSSAGDPRLTGIDARTGHTRWSVALGSTSAPTVAVAGTVIVIGDWLGRMATLVSLSGTVLDRWTDAEGRVFVDGSPQGEVAVGIGSSVTVRTSTGRVRWRGSMPGTVLGLRLNGPWLAALGTMVQNSYAPDRIWFVRTAHPAATP